MTDFERLTIQELRHHVDDRNEMVKALQDHITWAGINAPAGQRVDLTVIQENIRLTLRIEKLQNQLRILLGEPD